MKSDERYLLNQVFSVVIIFLLVATFYMLVASGLASQFEPVLNSLLLIVIAIVSIAILSEVTKIGCMLSKRK